MESSDHYTAYSYLRTLEKGKTLCKHIVFIVDEYLHTKTTFAIQSERERGDEKKEFDNASYQCF